MSNFSHLCPNCFADKQTAEQCPSCGYEETLSQQNPLYIKPRTLLNQRYLIGNVIGHGGFGITYLGWDSTLERKVAIKEFLPTTLATRISETNEGNTRYTVMHTGNQEEAFKKGLKKFKKEAKILAELTHENIVRVIDYLEAYNTGYIVMEYVGQEDLSQLLKRQPEKRFSVKEALEIFLPILSALKVIHANGIYHQDISLQNIRMVEGKKPVLIDFGAARYIVGGLSQSLDRIFKPGYSPIEQISNDSQKIGPWTDIYACGAVFYAMIVGELPPQSIDRLDRDDLVAPAQKKGVEMPSSVNNAVLKALSVRIGDRFQTVEEFEDALKNQKTDKNKRLLALAATAGGVFIVVVIAVVVLVDQDNPPVENSELPSSVEILSVINSEQPSVEPPPVVSEQPSVEPPIENSDLPSVEPPPVVRDLELPFSFSDYGTLGSASGGVEREQQVENQRQYIQVALRDATEIGQKIWMNEGSQQISKLTVWNQPEHFASLGIGHFIWYPEGREGPFTETFPDLLLFMEEQGVILPEWLDNTPDCPWETRQAFLDSQQSEKMVSLRTLMKNTIPIQVQFIIKRLELALPKILESLVTEAQRTPVRKQFYRVAQTAKGVYALLDYVHFKGEGISHTERYQNQGWGLLQVLEQMSGDSIENASREFADAAEFVLKRRINNAPVMKRVGYADGKRD